MKNPNSGHKWLYISGTTTSDLYHPNPKVEEVTTEITNGEGYGVGDDITESVFNPGTTGKDAIIYAITVYSATANTIAELRPFGAVSPIIECPSGASGIMNIITFGPEGIRIPNGFAVFTPGTAAVAVGVVYDVV